MRLGSIYTADRHVTTRERGRTFTVAVYNACCCICIAAVVAAAAGGVGAIRKHCIGSWLANLSLGSFVVSEYGRSVGGTAATRPIIRRVVVC